MRFDGFLVGHAVWHSATWAQRLRGHLGTPILHASFVGILPISRTPNTEANVAVIARLGRAPHAESLIHARMASLAIWIWVVPRVRRTCDFGAMRDEEMKRTVMTTYLTHKRHSIFRRSGPRWLFRFYGTHGSLHSQVMAPKRNMTMELKCPPADSAKRTCSSFWRATPTLYGGRPQSTRIDHWTGPLQFTGDLNLVDDQPMLVSARTSAAYTCLLRIPRQNLRQLMRARKVRLRTWLLKHSSGAELDWFRSAKLAAFFSDRAEAKTLKLHQFPRLACLRRPLEHLSCLDGQRHG